MECMKDIEMKTENSKRKRTDDESDDVKPEKRSRLDHISEKHYDDLKIKNCIALFEAEKPTLDEIDDKETAKIQPQAPDNSFAENEHKAKTENAIIPTESEVSRTDITNSGQYLDLHDVLNDGVVGEYKPIHSPTISETENHDESECTDNEGNENAFVNESVTGKGGDLNFDKIDSVEEKETNLDKCTKGQIEQTLEEKGYTNKGHISRDRMGQTEVQIEQIDVPDANSIENECANSVFTFEAEHQNASIDESEDRDNNVDEEIFLYRLLKPGESHHHGIKPDDIHSNTSIEFHVAYGSRDEVKSKYISCSKTITGIKKFASLIKMNWSQSRSIVKINKTKLSDDCKIFDLTEDSVRWKYLRSDRANKFSLRFDEVLLAPSCAIPVECITEVATVQNGEIHWKEDTL